ncbi:uncharacterized protein LOC115319502 [Ixodes scapularis]|uniref:uncharacterized protein LOC120846672 n=1 Tax=Ixodes scapularis TaxID=6945 RepID=UPI001AD7E0C8|nr:uncharacterized protein LOC120846672 [Ixodes scapularis]XP_042143390.1 uncharacterized protein LOC115319502 [Ixodes scapularis]
MLSSENAPATGRGTAEASASTTEMTTEEYRTVLPRLPTGNLSLNSVFLHGDLAARPYRATDFRDALRDVVDSQDIIGIGQFQMSHVWMVTCASALAKAKLVTKAELRVKGRRCLIIDPDTRDVKLKLLWLPVHMDNQRIEEALAPFGTVRSIVREKWRCAGMEQMETLNKEVTLTLHEGMNASQIPHQLTVFGCRSLVLVPGRPPLCLRCYRIGHIRRECRTPRCGECRRYGHATSECVTTYADKLRQARSPAEDVVLEHLMDISEVVDATGEVTPSSTTSGVQLTAPLHPPPDVNPESATITTESEKPESLLQDSEFPPLSTTSTDASQFSLHRRERSTTSSGTSVKRPAPTSEKSSQSSTTDVAIGHNSDERGDAKRRPAEVCENHYSKATRPADVVKDGDELPP